MFIIFLDVVLAGGDAGFDVVHRETHVLHSHARRVGVARRVAGVFFADFLIGDGDVVGELLRLHHNELRCPLLQLQRGQAAHLAVQRKTAVVQSLLHLKRADAAALQVFKLRDTLAGVGQRGQIQFTVKLVVALKVRRLAQILRKRPVADAVTVVLRVLGQEPLAHQFVHHLPLESAAGKPFRIGVAVGRAHLPAPLGQDVLVLVVINLNAVNVGDVHDGLALEIFADAPESERNAQQPDNKPGNPAAGAVTNGGEHGSNGGW